MDPVAVLTSVWGVEQGYDGLMVTQRRVRMMEAHEGVLAV